MELVTRRLTADEVGNLASHVAQLLTNWGMEDIVVSYGWECALDIEQLYHDIPLKTHQLEGFILDSVARSVFEFGNADLWISGKDRRVTFLLCHVYYELRQVIP